VELYSPAAVLEAAGLLEEESAKVETDTAMERRSARLE
jgi:hypothetical protein